MKTKKTLRLSILFISVGLFLGSCSSRKTAASDTKNYTKTDVVATYYHNKFNGRSTASGEKFHNSRMTAAHRTLPFGTIVKVTNPKNNKSVKVKINDRGPFTKGREIDMSRSAFMKITDDKKKGLLNVNLKVVK
ncbi:MAG: septal ring lytic transglycosylase RlpA family protein [Flavobacteriaceae bacterium]|nr:septal ring lytic transglycosylase RlpA family protein [Flavobacteriaceae bacterium]